MKIPSRASIPWSRIHLPFITVLLTLIYTQSTQACERSCQLSVSHAFADKYQLLTSRHFLTLSQKINQSFFHGVPPPPAAYTPTEGNNAILHLQESLTRAQQAWDVSLFRTVFDTIFVDEPQFRGDCNEPHRVDQPAAGVNWTMSDCHAMDYICGNPPSICHFLPMIKVRIERKLAGLLGVKVGGGSVGSSDGGSGTPGSADDGDLYANFLGPALSKVIMTHPTLEPYTATLHGNLNQILEIVGDQIVKEAALFARPGAEPFRGDERWRPEWDLEIKLLLLSFP
ncbi:hypothetical protein BGZ95_004492 [Linnemannia exigua]|uniref:Uncharacterized protein n=1 Tax=Linnemannia exigua TaxID=604196 RepID=A0AAD4H0S2_9FUNG|nr:hypothetical protein BGZ95_004492 [Linnemannia exigua]